MKLSKYFNIKQTKQTNKIPGQPMVVNQAGGYTFALDCWKTLDRFLILGTEGGTFYASESKATKRNADNLVKCLKADGMRTVDQICTISKSGRAPKNDPAIFALAVAASMGDDATRKNALSRLPEVARTGTHLFKFAAEIDNLRGWGRGLRKAIGNWYNQADPNDLTYQVIKYQSRDAWSNRDLLRLSHPVPASEDHKVIYKWIVDGELTGENPRLAAVQELKKTDSAKMAVALIKQFRLPREVIPTQFLNDPDVWAALLEEMPITALIRNLPTLTKHGLIGIRGDYVASVVERITDQDRLRKGRVHPIQVLSALKTYSGGRSTKGSNKWDPNPRIVDALDDAFHLSFASVNPTGKRILLGVDVSGSMGGSMISGLGMSAAEASIAMAMVTMAREPDVIPMAFSSGFVPLRITAKKSIMDAVRQTQGMPFDSTDCALPMIHATKNKIPTDLFVIYTDNETWFGNIHPVQALRQYRDTMGIAARLVVVGMTATEFSIADPSDSGMLDVVGFDSTAPQAISEFAGGA